MKKRHERDLFIEIGQATLHLCLKADFQDTVLPKETIEFLATVVIDKMIEGQVACNDLGNEGASNGI